MGDEIIAWRIDANLEPIEYARQKLTVRKALSSLWMSESGQYAAFYAGRKVFGWNTRTGELHQFDGKWAVRSHCPGAIQGRIMAKIGTSGVCHLLDLESLEVIKQLKAVKGVQVHCVAISGDGRYLAYGVAQGFSIRIVDIESDTVIKTLKGHRNRMTSVCFGANDSVLVSSAQDQSLRIWPLDTDRPPTVLLDETERTMALKLSTDADVILSQSRTHCTLWKSPSKVPNQVIQGKERSYVYVSRFSPTDNKIFFGGHGGHSFWNFDLGILEQTAGHDARIYDASFGPKGRHLALLGDREIALLDANSQTIIAQKSRPRATEFPDACWASDGQTLFLSSGAQYKARLARYAISILSVPDLSSIRELNHDQLPPMGLTLSPDEERLFAGYGNGDLLRWNLSSFQTESITKAHQKAITCLRRVRDGTHILSASLDGDVHAWDIETGEKVRTVCHLGHKIYDLAVSQDGSRIAIGCADGFIRLVEFESGETLTLLRGHTDYVHSVDFSSDGRRLVSGSGDCSVRIWDAGSPFPMPTPR